MTTEVDEESASNGGQTAPLDAPYQSYDEIDLDVVLVDENTSDSEGENPRDSPLDARLGHYSCKFVTNIPPSSDDNDTSNPRTYFDLGLRHFFAYQHEEAYKFFLACLTLAPDCAFAHGMVALCHCPNYNFKGDAYYESTDHPEEEETIFAEAGENGEDIAIMRRLYPSQQVAAKHALFAMEKVEELKKRHSQATHKPNESKSQETTQCSSQMISDVEIEILSAIRIHAGHPGIHPQLAEGTVGRPYVDALRRVHERFPEDAEVSYFFAESLMVLNAWNLYEYPTGRPLSKDVEEIERVLERALQLHPRHAGICHLYVHLCEMSSHPEKSMSACEALRTDFPDAGHLIHMPTHIDVLVGDYESCVEYNHNAILADLRIMLRSPDTAGTESFYFGYIVHGFHMLVYGGILGGMESIAMEKALELNQYLTEDLFIHNPDLAIYLESYAALDIHVMVRFGRWKEILQVPFPRYPLLMLFRSASLHYARGLALANTGKIRQAITEADLYDELRLNPSAEKRILHNNRVSALLAVDAPMLRGEIAYFSGNYDEAFPLLRYAVKLQDGLNYDEPWGKMQPIRHPLGGLLCDQGHYEESEQVFREDLKFHPRNPWGLAGLIICLKGQLAQGSCCSKKYGCSQDGITIAGRVINDILLEVENLTLVLAEQRKSKYADSFDITAPCACCRKMLPK
ncbi:hypothetical protein ACHAW5_005677 [Stephanodiscus triporus]|uniref:Tetratricopeptide repeat protein 38 n=1 Tax=Stephanodiscus triporus TaxID=2934178 RepID=A0ABD3NPA0_9STRA